MTTTATSSATASAAPPPSAGAEPPGAEPPGTEPAEPTTRWPWLPGRRAADEVTIITVWLVLLFGLPERLIIPQLGGTGAPATLFSLAIFGMWALARLVPSQTRGGRQPIRQALVVWFCATLLTYIVAVLRGLTGVEQRASDRYVISLLGLAGVALMIADYVPSRVRLDTLLKRLTVAGAALSMMGIVEQFTGFIYASFVRVPGLAVNGELFLEVQRGTLARITGTANHPIGYGVPLALILPLAIHYAVVAPKGAERQWRVAVAAAVGAGIPLSISRSAVVAMIVGLLVLLAGWSWRRRVNALGIAAAAMVLYQGLFPGRLVTLLNLFINYDSDASVTARTRDYDAVFTYIDQNQLFGLGPGTFLPSVYLQLDNQILKFILEGGLIGTTAVVLVYVTSVRLSQAVRRVVPDEETRQLALALSAIVVGAGVTCFTFDAFSFSFYPGVLFIVFGAAGALWRLTLKDYL